MNSGRDSVVSPNEYLPQPAPGMPASCVDPIPGPAAHGPAPIMAGESELPEAPMMGGGAAWITQGGGGRPAGRT